MSCFFLRTLRPVAATALVVTAAWVLIGMAFLAPASAGATATPTAFPSAQLTPDDTNYSTQLLAARGVDSGCMMLAAFAYVFVTCAAEGHQFCGHGGGAFSTVWAEAGGTLTIEDERIFEDTHSFQFTGVAFYMNVNFFSANGRLLGHFHGGQLVGAQGIGGGSGRWMAPHSC